MKKLATILAAIMVCSALFACDSGDDAQTTAAKTDAPAATTTVAQTTTAPNVTTEDPTTPPSTPAVDPDYVPADSTRFKIDGDLSDWEGLETISVIGEGSTEPKKVTFYAAATEKGLYLACDAYHELYISDGGEWYTNTNFEFFIGGESNQFYVSAKDYPIGSTDTQPTLGAPDGYQIDEAVMVTKENEGGTAYHTIVEVFIATESLPEFAYDTDYYYANVGLGWKTVGDLLIGGSCDANPDGSDEYWTYHWPRTCDLTIFGRGLVDENA